MHKHLLHYKWSYITVDICIEKKLCFDSFFTTCILILFRPMGFYIKLDKQKLYGPLHMLRNNRL